MIYLAQPYSHSDSKVREWRYQMALYVAHLLFKTKQPVFSPIIHWHVVAATYDLPKDADTWWQFNLSMLNRARKFYLLNIDGWKESRGVYRELDYAEKRGLPVFLCEIKAGELDAVLDIILTSPAILMREFAHYAKDSSNGKSEPTNAKDSNAG